ncbi:hypothetical protein [Cohnella sp. 56]
MNLTAANIIGLLLCVVFPYMAYRMNRYLHDKSDPSWKKKK